MAGRRSFGWCLLAGLCLAGPVGAQTGYYGYPPPAPGWHPMYVGGYASCCPPGYYPVPVWISLSSPGYQTQGPLTYGTLQPTLNKPAPAAAPAPVAAPAPPPATVTAKYAPAPVVETYSPPAPTYIETPVPVKPEAAAKPAVESVPKSVPPTDLKEPAAAKPGPFKTFVNYVSKPFKRS